MAAVLITDHVLMRGIRAELPIFMRNRVRALQFLMPNGVKIFHARRGRLLGRLAQKTSSPDI